EDSLTHDETLTDEKNAIAAFTMIRDELEKKYPFEVEGIFIKHLLYSTVITMLRRNYKIEDIKKHIKYWERIYPEWYTHEEIKYYTRYQKFSLYLIKNKRMLSLKIVSKLKTIKTKYL